MRTDRYKLIHYHGVWETDELHDVQDDPDEMHNLIDAPEHPKLVADLQKRMYDWLEQTNGMQIPLRRQAGFKGNRSGPKTVKELKFYEENK